MPLVLLRDIDRLYTAACHSVSTCRVNTSRAPQSSDAGVRAHIETEEKKKSLATRQLLSEVYPRL